MEFPAQFLHFLDQRMKAHALSEFDATDEMEHFALYLNDNQYTRVIEELSNEGHVSFFGVKDSIDAYYHRLWNEVTPNPKPQQELPGKYGELVAALSANAVDVEIKAAKYLLNFDGATRRRIAEVIEQMLDSQRRDQRIKPLHTGGENPFTLFAFTPGLPRAGWDAIACRRYTLAAMKARGDAERLLLQVYFDEQDQISSVLVTFLVKDDVTAELVGSLDLLAQAFEESVARQEGRQKKVGRNELCPCGSGRKYKKCHGKPNSHQ